MPMQRKRPRERETRFHYRFLERFDLIETSEVALLSVCFILILGMQARRGINAEEMLLAGIITALASALSKEAHKKRCTSRLPPESKPLRIEDLRSCSTTNRSIKKIILDSERHYCYADTAMLIFLARMASPSSFVTVMVWHD
jgi:hypothetical protein